MGRRGVTGRRVVRRMGGAVVWEGLGRRVAGRRGVRGGCWVGAWRSEGRAVRLMDERCLGKGWRGGRRVGAALGAVVG